jgi:hypothetical protein
MDDKNLLSKRLNKIIIWLSVLVFIFLIAFLAQHAMPIYVDKVNKFSMRFPATWKKVENRDGAAVIFISPLQNKLDIFPENVNVVVQDISGNIMSLEDYTRTAIMQVQVVFKDSIQITQSEGTYLSGHPAYKFVYIGKGPETEFKIMHVWTVVGTTAYQITYTALASQFDQYIDQVNKMVDSFRLH